MKKLLLKHIMDYSSDELVKKVLDCDSTFKQEVEDFYGLHTWYCGGGLGDPSKGRIYELTDKVDDSKKEEVPHTLIEILDPFSEHTFDPDLLSYDSVHTSLKEYKGYRTRELITGGICFTVGTVSAGILKDHYATIVAAIPAMAAILSTVYFIRQKDPPLNNPLRQYLEMHNASFNADSLINKSNE